VVKWSRKKRRNQAEQDSRKRINFNDLQGLFLYIFRDSKTSSKWAFFPVKWLFFGVYWIGFWQNISEFENNIFQMQFFGH